VQGVELVTLQFERLFRRYSHSSAWAVSTIAPVISLVLFVAFRWYTERPQVDIARTDAIRGSTQAEALG